VSENAGVLIDSSGIALIKEECGDNAYDNGDEAYPAHASRHCCNLLDRDVENFGMKVRLE
jgi:hypothetical protein